MLIRTMDLDGITAKNHSEETKVVLGEWKAGVLAARKRSEEEGVRAPTHVDGATIKYGLWIFGNRLAGTSYIGKEATARLTYNHGYHGEVIAAADLIQMISGIWTITDQMRRNNDDVGLWWEAKGAEDALDYYFRVCDLLMVDDVHDEAIGMKIWKRHIQPQIEQRVKRGMPTIVCTTLPPDDEALPPRVVDGLFVTLHAER